MKNNDFTEGAILPKLLKFMLPVLFAMFLQAMYGAVDLLVVGRFGTDNDVSAVSTGSQILQTLTNLIVSFSMGITVAVAQRIGQNRPEEAARTVGTGLVIFAITGVVFTVISVLGAGGLAKIMQAPEEAYDLTKSYIRLCGGGFIVITAYNLLGSIFRGLGDAKTPLIAVGIACAFNIVGDLVFVSKFHMGATGAALATVLAQLVSVTISFFIIRRTKLPFEFHKSNLKLEGNYARNIIRIGSPIALQDFLVSVSFLVLVAIVNKLGVTASAGVGVAQKVCAFIMLVPLAFMQSMAAFVAQNYGAGHTDRAVKALKSGIAVSLVFGIAMFFVAFFHGDLLSGIFSNKPDTVAAAWDYLKAYAIDCLFTCFLFCFVGFYNGIEKTKFVMAQGICGAFLVRIPFAFFMQKTGGGSLFKIGLATPCSTVLQIIMCFIAYIIFTKNRTSVFPKEKI
ncbi:sodium transporter [Ruminococcus albus SY3]|uniref:Probable multidrug resistance protein NorM n=1 Tax=Ruminococcus albus SY3 TaxID=1341156 RepID=A0A011VUQ7_RUMAL|nr:MATE family efflux transporter [Ruminococcus albus]EXM38976.1 sodium transporter [Ruminococcus albus SY3]